MIDEHTEEVASLYAFDLLEGEEKSAFEQRLAQEPALCTLVNELRAASHGIASLAPLASPSPALRNRVMASVSDPRVPSRSHPLRFVLWAGWAAAAGFALAAASLGHLYLEARTDAVAGRESAAIAKVDAESTRQLLEAERLLSQGQLQSLRLAESRIATLQQQADLAQLKIASLTSLLVDSPQAQAIAVWSTEAQEGILAVVNLPALPANRDYQLWVIDPQYSLPVDGGVFTVEPSRGEARVQFKPKERIAQAVKFAVSLERKGGVAKAEGPMVLISP